MTSDTVESTRGPFGLTIIVSLIAESSGYDNVQKW